MKNNKLKTCVLLLMGFGLQTTQAQTALFVNQKVGANTAYNLSTLKKLTFASGNVTVVKQDANTSSFVRANVQFLNFGDIKSTDIVSINEEQPPRLTLFPNPVQDVLNLEIAKADLLTTQIEIIGIDGKVAFRSVLHNDKSSISVSFLPKGLYLLRSSNGINTTNLKFIKQ